MSFLRSIFGGGDEKRRDPDPIEQPIEDPDEETEVKSVVSPQEEEARVASGKQRKAILARRGRSSLVTSRDRTGSSGGVSISGTG